MWRREELLLMLTLPLQLLKGCFQKAPVNQCGLILGFAGPVNIGPFAVLWHSAVTWQLLGWRFDPTWGQMMLSTNTPWDSCCYYVGVVTMSFGNLAEQPCGGRTETNYLYFYHLHVVLDTIIMTSARLGATTVTVFMSTSHSSVLHDASLYYHGIESQGIQMPEYSKT